MFRFLFMRSRLRGSGQTAVSIDHGSDSLPVQQLIVPACERFPVSVPVNIDKAWRDVSASGIDDDGIIFLARPWRDYGLSRFENCSYGSHISPLGFDKWNDTDRDRTARFYETPAVPGRVSWVK